MLSSGSVLFVDAYDSFAENIAALLHQLLGVQVTLIKIDCDVQEQFGQSLDDFLASFDAIVLGPGPGNPTNPNDVGLFVQVWEYAGKYNIPVLAICLGFQSLCARHGLPIIRMGLPCHGHAKQIHHADRDVFRGAGTTLATCYNSLGVRLGDFKQDEKTSRPSSSHSSRSASSSESIDRQVGRYEQHGVGDDLEVLAWDDYGWVMAIRHNILPIHGFQFHPESCKSNLACHSLVKEWWHSATAFNKIHRAPIRLRRPDTTAPEGDKAPTITKPAQMVLNQMLSCTSMCIGTVTSRSLHFPRGAGIIADLCQQNSRPDRTAMLESTKRGRYNIYGFPHRNGLLVESRSGRVTLHFTVEGDDSHVTYEVDRDAFVEVLELFIHTRSFAENNCVIPFRGGFIGFMSYEFGMAGLQMEYSHYHGPSSSTPEMCLLWVDRSIVYDHETGTAHVQSIRENDAWVEEMTTILRSTSEGPLRNSRSAKNDEAQELLCSASYTMPDHDSYVSQIQACQSQLRAGNSYELCLTTEATVTTSVSAEGPYLMYRNIQRYNPVPFASYISLNKTTILSSSPEQFLSWSVLDGTIDMIPMKGTVKRTPEMTLAKATTILSSAKESAENLMIADLIRHDLYSTVGRDAKVEVVKLCDVVESETVFSLVSHIRAHVPAISDVEQHSDRRAQEMARYGIRAVTRTLPPGSMTGAPKKRSCEILHELEQRHRGVYSGGIGYIDVCGNGAWSVCIRSAFSNHQKDIFRDESTGQERQRWRVGAGGAITVLSDDEQEWEEMMTKLDSVLRGFRVDSPLK